PQSTARVAGDRTHSRRGEPEDPRGLVGAQFADLVERDYVALRAGQATDEALDHEPGLDAVEGPRGARGDRQTDGTESVEEKSPAPPGPREVPRPPDEDGADPSLERSHRRVEARERAVRREQHVLDEVRHVGCRNSE